MGFFDNIKNAIFHPAQAKSPAPTTVSAAPTTTASTAPTSTTSRAPTPAAAPSASTPAAAPGSVDVTAILDKAVAAKGQKLDWRHSIVDLMKAIDVDSSLTARKALAHELNYTGDTNDSATMNIWLHKAVIQKLADNGGKVPADLLH